MRIHIDALGCRRDFHRVQHADGFGTRLGFTHALVQAQDLIQLLTHAQIRIERGHRVLKNHRDFVRAYFIQLRFR